MPEKETVADETGMDAESEERRLFGLTRDLRYKIYAWGALAIVIGGIIWSISYLQPWRWHKYTDKISVEKVAVEVEPGYVLWDNAEAVDAGIKEENYIDS